MIGDLDGDHRAARGRIALALVGRLAALAGALCLLSGTGVAHADPRFVLTQVGCRPGPQRALRDLRHGHSCHLQPGSRRRGSRRGQRACRRRDRGRVHHAGPRQHEHRRNRRGGDQAVRRDDHPLTNAPVRRSVREQRPDSASARARRHAAADGTVGGLQRAGGPLGSAQRACVTSDRTKTTRETQTRQRERPARTQHRQHQIRTGIVPHVRSHASDPVTQSSHPAAVERLWTRRGRVVGFEVAAVPPSFSAPWRPRRLDAWDEEAAGRPSCSPPFSPSPRESHAMRAAAPRSPP